MGGGDQSREYFRRVNYARGEPCSNPYAADDKGALALMSARGECLCIIAAFSERPDS